MTKRDMSKFRELVSYLKKDHIPAARDIRALNIATHKLAHEIAGAACVYARSLKDDPNRRAEFYKEAFPDGFQRFHRGKLLLHVVMYFHGVANRKDDNYGIASAHSLAMQEVYNNDDIVDEDIVHHIEAQGGFAGLRGDNDEDNADDGADEELPEQKGDNRANKSVQPRRTKPASIFSDQDGDDLVAEDEEVEQEHATSGEANNLIPLPVRKPPKPAVTLKRLPRSYIDRCTLGWPATAAIGEAILEAARNGKPVWVKLVPGQISDQYELYKGGGGFIELSMEEFDIE